MNSYYHNYLIPLCCCCFSAHTGKQSNNSAVLLCDQLIRKTHPCNEHPLTPHFYIVKLGFTRVYIIIHSRYILPYIAWTCFRNVTWVRYIDKSSTLLTKSYISDQVNLPLVVHAGLCLTWLKTPDMPVFSCHRSSFIPFSVYKYNQFMTNPYNVGPLKSYLALKTKLTGFYGEDFFCFFFFI